MFIEGNIWAIPNDMVVLLMLWHGIPALMGGLGAWSLVRRFKRRFSRVE